jgi:adenylate cyclase, class 2
MQTEFEAKFLNIDPVAMRDQLATSGYTCTKPNTLMTRVTLHKPDYDRVSHEWWRVRDEGDGVITMTYKRTDADTLDGTREIETTVGHFEQAISMLESTGLKRVAFQETRRETWHQGPIMITIDEWPGLKPFIEIEGTDRPSVENAARLLGFDPDRAVFGGVGNIYQLELGIAAGDVNNYAEILFSNPPRDKNL